MWNPIAKRKALRASEAAQLAAQQETDRRQELLATRLLEIQIRCEYYGLDQQLLEIQTLVRHVTWVTLNSTHDPMVDKLIKMIDPWDCVRLTPHGVVVLSERWFGHTLMPWTVIEWQLSRKRIHSLDTIMVSKSGTYLYRVRGVDDGLVLVAHYRAGVCDPDRFADPGNRLWNAARVVNYFTGLQLSADDLAGQYTARFDRTADGWSATYSKDPATASVHLSPEH
jgi:hypothetical protein